MTAHGLPERFFRETVMAHTADDCLAWPFNRNDQGYGMIWDGERPTYVHRRVCEEVHGKPPSPKHHAAHSCGRGHEGCVAQKHLSWKTAKQNSADRIEHGTNLRGERHGAAKLTADQVLEIRALSASGMRLQDLADRFGIAKTTASGIVHRHIWKWLESPTAGETP